MTPIDLLHLVVNPALKELAPRIMPGNPARRQLITTAMQEAGADLEARYQHGGGPARGLWQFERIAVLDVMTRDRSERYARKALEDRGFAYVKPRTMNDKIVIEVHEALAKDDILAAIFARLNYWNDPEPLARCNEPDRGWQMYLRVWRPGAYTRGTKDERAALARKWDRNWVAASNAIDAEGPMP